MMAIETLSELHCSIPAQRRRSLVTPRSSDLEPSRQWTAASCNRLLRPLTSRVAILRKEISLCSSAVEGQSTDDKTGLISQRLPERFKMPDLGEDVWRRGTKKIRRTYSGKTGRGPIAPCGKPVDKSTLKRRALLHPGEITVATPVLAWAARERTHDQRAAVTEPLPVNETHSQRKRKRPASQQPLSEPGFQLSHSLPDIRRRVLAARYNIYEGIYNGLDALLKSTASNWHLEKPEHRKTLLSTCLRAVPKFIALEEGLLAAHLEQTGCRSALNLRDVGTEVYDDLETLSLSGNGWRQLKVVARSHGIYVITDAIHAGLFHIDFCGALITLCMQQVAQKEAEALLSALISRFSPSGPKNINTRFADDPAFRPLAMLWKYVDQTGRYTYQFKMLTAMISEDVLSVEWLATKAFSPVWSEVVKQLSLNPDCPEASAFLEVALSRLIRVGEKQTGTDENRAVISSVALNTTSSLLANLTSLVMLSNQDNACAGGSCEVPEHYFHNDHIMTLLRTCLVHSEVYGKTSDGSPLLLFANLLLGGGHDVAYATPGLLIRFVLQLSTGGDHHKDLSVRYRAVVLFVCMIARCCGKGSFTQGFEHLKSMHRILETLAANFPDANILRRIIVDSAINFAQQVPDWRHVDYATVVDSELHVHTKDGQSLPSEELRKEIGQRWEEGIGEWVTMTPVIIKTRPSMRMLTIRTASRKWPLGCALAPYQHEEDDSSGTESGIESSGSSLRCSESLQPSTKPFRPPSLLCDESSGEEESKFSSTCESSPYNSHWESLLHDHAESPAAFKKTTDIEAVDLNPLAEEIQDSGELRHFIDPVPRPRKKILRSTQGRGYYLPLCGSSPSPSPAHGLGMNLRKFISRVPRLGSRALRSASTLELFGESEDELSTISLDCGGQEELYKAEWCDTSTDSPCPAKTTERTRRTVVAVAQPWSDSEDELGM